jgi:hypothetical protein
VRFIFNDLDKGYRIEPAPAPDREETPAGRLGNCPGSDPDIAAADGNPATTSNVPISRVFQNGTDRRSTTRRSRRTPPWPWWHVYRWAPTLTKCASVDDYSGAPT